MTTDALRTAVALYTSGTIDDAEAARYLGLSPRRWAAYRRSHGLSAPSTEAVPEEPLRA
jgi:hypothetical protein